MHSDNKSRRDVACYLPLHKPRCGKQDVGSYATVRGRPGRHMVCFVRVRPHRVKSRLLKEPFRNTQHKPSMPQHALVSEGSIAMLSNFLKRTVRISRLTLPRNCFSLLSAASCKGALP